MGDAAQKSLSPAAGRDKKVYIGAADYTIYLVVVILVFIGIIMVFSASFMSAGTSAVYNYDQYFFLKKQALSAAMGICILHLVSNTNYRYLQRFAFLIYLMSIVLLVIVFFIGRATRGQVRWIPIPVVGQFQPSELAKLAVILMVSFMVAKNRSILLRWPTFLLCCAVVGAVAALVGLSDLGTAIIIVMIGIGMIFIACPYLMRFIIGGALGAGGVVGYLIYVSRFPGDDFRGGRWLAFLDPFEYRQDYGWQIVQSLYAIASGGMFGLGIGQSRQKTYIPEAHNDIIFSIICEELGFIGAFMVLLLFGILIWRGIRIALKAPDLFGSLIAAGVVIMIAVQVLINVAVVTGSIPNTGVPLPFISYGGTSMVVVMSSVGILLNISRHSRS